MHRFLKSSRAEHQQEVSSVSGEVIWSPRGDATSICPITGQPSLAPISVTRIAIGPSCDGTHGLIEFLLSRQSFSAAFQVALRFPELPSKWNCIIEPRAAPE